MKMERRKFRIGELAKKVGVEQFVIRFWEKEFSISSNRSHGGQRFYDEKDFMKFKKIRGLLYEKKFTIAGAKAELKATSKSSRTAEPTYIPSKIAKQLVDLQDKLTKLRELL